MSKVKKIKVQNLKAISEFEADFGGCTAIITGGNNKGKSSFLRALPDRFRGIKPGVIVKHDEKDGFAEWELTDGVKLIWSFDTTTKKGERLTIVTQEVNGNELKGSVTEAIMQQYFPGIFDVDAFLQSTPAKQRKTLQNLCNIDFTDIDDRYKVAYEDRTFKNKKRDDAKILLKPVNQSLPVKEADPLPLQNELTLISSHNEKFDSIKRALAEKRVQLPKTQQEIKRLELLLKNARAEEAKLTKEIAYGDVWMLVDKNKYKDEVYTADLKKRYDKVVADNLLIVQNNKNIKAKQDFELLKTAADKANEAVDAIITEKDTMIAGAKMPDGFGFTDDGITYNGLEFTREQLSSSAIYIASLKLASMNLGEVKMLHFDASFLDKNSLAEIELWANENDLQLLIERPDFDGGEIQYQIISEIA
jgi:predicted ATP-dependent endonuclease of OLD family